MLHLDTICFSKIETKLHPWTLTYKFQRNLTLISGSIVTMMIYVESCKLRCKCIPILWKYKLNNIQQSITWPLSLRKIDTLLARSRITACQLLYRYCSSYSHTFTQDFFFLGGPPSGKNFVNPQSNTSPRLWTEACSPQPWFVHENLNNLNTFLCQIWLRYFHAQKL